MWVSRVEVYKPGGNSAITEAKKSIRRRFEGSKYIEHPHLKRKNEHVWIEIISMPNNWSTQKKEKNKNQKSCIC